jgi:nicotinate-nucleotide adenylyltransferase
VGGDTLTSASPAGQGSSAGDLGANLRGALGVFGGTFDPIHVAHLAVAEAARDALGLERVLFVPAGEPPHKIGRPITPADQRLAMVEAATAGNDGFAVTRMELDRGGPSYTVDTLRDLRAARLAAGESPTMALVLSAEAFVELPTWHDPEGVRGLAAFIVAPRDGYPEAAPDFLERHFPGVEARAVFLDGPRMRLSASDLRSRARAGRSIRYLVPDAVAAFIGDHALYQDSRRTHRS